MIILGLTGSIASGKSFVSRYLDKKGYPVFDADKEVHNLLDSDLILKDVEKHFPDTVQDGKVSRLLLGERVFNDNEKRTILESILHPLIRDREIDFLKRLATSGKAIAILDIPLLFETGADELCDKIMLTDADHQTMKKRALRREGMTLEKFNSILALQLPSEEKRKRSDYIIDTTKDKYDVYEQVDNAVSDILMKQKVTT